MTFERFKNSLNDDAPPSGITDAVRALWVDAKGDWDHAHRIAQEIPNPTGSWVHAYLHRKEGDLGNARYWYHRAGRPESRTTLEQEWESIVRALLGQKD